MLSSNCKLVVRRSWLRCLAFSCVWLASAAGARADAECARPHIRWRSGVSLHWQRALLAACDELASASGVDSSVDVRASQRGRGIQLAAVAGDGRTTTRSVHNADELLMTMQALVLLPPSPPRAAEAQTQPVPSADQRSDRKLPAAIEPAHSEPRSSLQVELAAALMGRLAFLPDYMSPALWLSVGVHVSRFTLGVDARWNPLQTRISLPHPVGLEVESMGAGFFVTHRVIDVDWTALDLGVQVFLSADTRASEQNETATEHTEADGRFGVVARWGLGHRAARWAFMLDAELSPARLRTRSDFPAFSLGFGGGGVWEVK